MNMKALIKLVLPLSLFNSILSTLFVLCLLQFENAHSSCQEPASKLKLTFQQTYQTGEKTHRKISGSLTSFGNIDMFYDEEIDFKISENIEKDELYSVILVKQTEYPRLEPNGDIRLKWFVANIPGKNLTKGKSFWNGTMLAGFEPIKEHEFTSERSKNAFYDSSDDAEEAKEYHLLWLFKHVDGLLIEDYLSEYDRDNFALQMYYDYLCSKPFIEIAFVNNNDIDTVKSDVNTYKRVQN